MAVNALLGAGVKCVIAKSFAFIYARNQPNVGLLGITIQNQEFFDVAQAGEYIEVDIDKSEVRCGGKTFGFTLSSMEKQLILAGGLTEAFKRYGKRVFDELCRPKAVRSKETVRDVETLQV
jgi:3-isopropylmalate dehydratase small subunit